MRCMYKMKFRGKFVCSETRMGRHCPYQHYQCEVKKEQKFLCDRV